MERFHLSTGSPLALYQIKVKEVNVQKAIKHRGVIQTLGLVGLHTAFLELLFQITQLDQIHEIHEMPQMSLS